MKRVVFGLVILCSAVASTNEGRRFFSHGVAVSIRLIYALYPGSQTGITISTPGTTRNNVEVSYPTVYYSDNNSVVSSIDGYYATNRAAVAAAGVTIRNCLNGSDKFLIGTNCDFQPGPAFTLNFVAKGLQGQLSGTMSMSGTTSQQVTDWTATNTVTSDCGIVDGAFPLSIKNSSISPCPWSDSSGYSTGNFGYQNYNCGAGECCCVDADSNCIGCTVSRYLPDTANSTISSCSNDGLHYETVW